MKHFVIISQIIFPADFPRAYRATELAKELGRQGHQVSLYGVLGNFNYSRFEFENPNVKVKNIGKMYFAKFNSDNTYRPTILDRGLKKIFGKILDFPDIELSLKVPKIIKNEYNVDCLITVAMPFAIHWGAAYSKLRRKTNFPKTWLADCGDPYMGNSVIKHYFYFKYLEKLFCRKADFIIIPNEAAREGYYPEFQHKIRIIPQGFDFSEFLANAEASKNEVPTFAYAGTFYKGFRDPTFFLEYLTNVEKDFRFIIFSKTHEIVLPFVEKLGKRIELHDYIERKELLKFLSRMDFLINFENKSSVQSPSKIIDYALSKRPILSLRPDQISIGDFDEFLDGNYENQFIVNDLDQYNIQNVAKEFLLLS